MFNIVICVVIVVVFVIVVGFLYGSHTTEVVAPQLSESLGGFNFIFAVTYFMIRRQHITLNFRFS